MARRLEAALKQLSFEHRSIIALSGLEGLSPAEVAATLGIPVGTVHSRLSRARAKLKELLETD
jgi:RNA polymerase sigma-70 factor (ECF subfamily)